MFHEAVDHVLRFIGTRPYDVGCSSTELGDYINEDVIPYFGFTSNEVLCSSIMRLAIDRHFQEMKIVKKNANDGVLGSTSANGNNTNQSDTHTCCTKSEVLRLLDESSVIISTLAATEQRKKSSAFILVIFPLAILSERIFGFSLRLGVDREGMRHVCHHAIEGVDPMGSKGGKYLVSRGIKAFLSTGVVQVVFLLDVKNQILYKRFFPFFALPKPSLLEAQQGQNGFSSLQPLDHFFQRSRRCPSVVVAPKSPFSSLVVLNLSLIKHIISTSPERKLLLQDAVDSVLKAHRCIPFRYHELPHTMKGRLVSLFEAAGLRVVIAQMTTARGSVRQLKLVIPEEDWEVFKDEQRLQKNVGGGVKKEQESDESASSSDEDETNQNEDVGQADRKGSDENVLEQDQLLKAAQLPFFSSPDFPRAVQFCKEAERRPIALVGSYPHVRLANQRPTARYLYQLVLRYHEMSNTINRCSGVLSGKQFSLVFYPKDESTPETEQASEVTMKQEPLEDPQSSDTVTTKLPPGLSSYSVTKVMNALESSTTKTVTFGYLASLLDITTLRRRVLPYLKEIGKIQTSGYTPPKHRRRIGIISLAGVELTEELKAQVVEEYEAAGALATASSLGKASVSIDKLPEMFSADPTSDARGKIENTVSTAKVLGTMNRIFMCRNGYSRHGVHRAGRLHMELWRQYYQRTMDAVENGKESGVDLKHMRTSLEETYTNMSLSTFCVVIGMPQVDLGVFKELNQSPNARDPVSPPVLGQLQWSTKIADLSPSLREWCITQGTVTFCNAIKELASRNLIRCIKRNQVVVLNPLLVISLHEIEVVLEPQGFVDQVKYTFYDENEEYTAGRTAHALLLYWEYIWKNVTHHPFLYYSQSRQHIDVAELEKHLTLAKTIVASKFFRLDVSVLGELVFQRCGRRIPRKRRNRFTDFFLDSNEAKKSKTSVKIGITALDRSTSMVTRIGRVDVTGETVSRVIRVALESDMPINNIVLVTSAVSRATRKNQSTNPLLTVYNRLSRASVYHLAHLTRLATAKYFSELENPGKRQNAVARNAKEEQEELHQALRRILSPDVANDTNDTTLSRENPDPLQDVLVASEQETNVSDEKTYQTQSLADSSTSPAAENSISEELFEVLLDAFRCILLTDQSHYKPNVAKELIGAFPPMEVARARRYLLQKRCFTRGNARGRIPLITLSEGLSIISPATIRRLPNPCTNTLLAHDWVNTWEEITVATRGVEQHSMVPPRPGSTIHQESVNGDRGRDDGENLPLLRMKKRPKTVDVRLSEPIQLHAQQLMQSDDMLVSLNCPSFSFSNVAFALDGQHCAEKRVNEKSLRKTTRILYPARIMTYSVKEVTTGSPSRVPRRAILMAADNCPGDPSPSEQQKQAVEKMIESIKNGVTPSSCSNSTADCPLPYPSIFHHVDGASHQYVWKIFLEVLLRYVSRVPGISYNNLKEVITEDGVIGRRSFDAGIMHLLHCGDLIAREMWTPSSQTLGTDNESSQSPFAPARKRRRETQDDETHETDGRPFMPSSSIWENTPLSKLCFYPYLRVDFS